MVTTRTHASDNKTVSLADATHASLSVGPPTQHDLHSAYPSTMSRDGRSSSHSHHRRHHAHDPSGPTDRLAQLLSILPVPNHHNVTPDYTYPHHGVLDAYPPPASDMKLPKKPPTGPHKYTTKWKLANDKNKGRQRQAYYGGMGGMGGMYPGMMGGMGAMGGMGPMAGMGMYPGMMGGMGGMGMGGMTPMMGGGYGMPRYPTGGMGYGGMMGGYPGMGGDPYMNFGAPPAANWVDDFADAHRVEHAYRQSAPDNYGVGLGMLGGMGGGMGINNMPGSQMLLYGRGMYPGGWYQ